MADELRRVNIEHMSDLSFAERLLALRFHRNVLVGDHARNLARVDGWIADTERRAAEEKTAREQAPPPAEWLLQNPGGTAAAILHTTIGEHAGACWIAEPRDVRTRGITRQQAAQALTDGAAACELCRPDTALGFLG